MSTQILEQHIVSTPGTLGGKPRIAGRRISVESIKVWHEELGYSVDKIASDYDLTLGQVYAALAYYWDHKQEIDAMTIEGERFIDELRVQQPSRLGALLNERSHQVLP